MGLLPDMRFKLIKFQNEAISNYKMQFQQQSKGFRAVSKWSLSMFDDALRVILKMEATSSSQPF